MQVPGPGDMVEPLAPFHRNLGQRIDGIFETGAPHRRVNIQDPGIGGSVIAAPRDQAQILGEIDEAGLLGAEAFETVIVARIISRW